jgi:hypothetical protein
LHLTRHTLHDEALGVATSLGVLHQQGLQQEARLRRVFIALVCTWQQHAVDESLEGVSISGHLAIFCETRV